MEETTRVRRTVAGRVSAAAVARAAGVSPAAVSYVMNGKGGVAPDTRRRVLSVARDLGFQPRRPAPAVDPDRSRVIGLVMPNIINPVYPCFAQGIVSAGAAAGYEVFVATTQDDPDVLRQVTATLIERNADGVILAGTLREDATALRLLRAAKIPFACLSRRSPYLEADFVGIDDDAAAEAMMRHVLSHGHTEIATVIGPRLSSSSLTREQAFIRTAAAAGVEIGGDRKISTALSSAGGRIAAERLFAADRPPRAVVCGSDEIAIGIMEHAVARGLRVPEDVAVTGGDGHPHSISALIDLTTVVQPQQEMAVEALGLVLKRIERPSTVHQSLICAHRLHIGRTCGCDPAARR
ncbi:LacI family DNA-binding transcriptional regulator [Saccharopolyspora cebuensis]|uniref:LacI family DNA-binding transcriptional regulator n=1 Tax=Saccharopolyspora cebuensis TaxID=418759 RepID=A0ABV4C9M6_9PSEU